MKTSTLIISGFILLFVSARSFSESIVVTTGSDSIAGSLRVVISQAKSGDIIKFSPNLSLIKVGKQINIDKSLTIIGNPNLTISGRGESSIFPRVFEIAGDQEINVTFETLHFIKTGFFIGDTVSYDTNGGIILIRNLNSTIDINFCYFTKAGAYGGIINCTGPKVNGQNGGAIAQYGGTLNISNSTFSGLESGGPKYWGAGGAICQFGGSLNIVNSTFFDNTAGKTSCGNAVGNGAAIYTQDGTTTITSCTFAKHRTSFSWWVGLTNYSGHTHSVSVNNSALTVKNSLFYSNEGYDINGSFYSGGYNIFNQLVTTSDKTTIRTGNPGFSNAALSNKSFWIPVLALDAAGPAIDALPADGNGAPQFDQRGYPRVNLPDIGACEFEGCIPNEVKANWAFSDIGQDSWISDISVVSDDVVWVKDMNADSISITTNGGASWAAKPLPVPGRSAGGICALDEKTAYYILSVTDQKGIYKTTNGGVTWTKQETGFNQSSPFPDIIHFWNQNEGVAIGDADPNQNFEIYTTSNGGDQWNRVANMNMPDGNKETTSNGQSTFRVNGNSICFITNAARIFKSADRGKTWNVVNTPFCNTSLAKEMITFDFKDENNGLTAYCSSDGTVKHIYKTTDGGQSWDKLLSMNFHQHIFYVPTANAFFSLNPAGGLSYSCDVGQTWTSVSGFDGIKLRIAAYSPMGKVFLGGLKTIYYPTQVLSVSPANLTISAQANSTKTFEIVSNIYWNVSSNQSWLIPDYSHGSGNSTIILTAQANPSSKARLATITVSGNGVASKTLAIVQDGETSGKGNIAKNGLAVYPIPVKQILYFSQQLKDACISVFDLSGRKIFAEQANTKEIDVSGLVPGIYTIRIVENGKCSVFRFIKI